MNLLQILLFVFAHLDYLFLFMTWLLLWSYIVNNPVIKFLKEMSYLDGLDLINVAQH